MSRYCIDTDPFIQAKNGPYGFDFHPAFWNFLDEQAKLGNVFSSRMVYDELTEGNDELATWAKARKDSGLFIESTREVQESCRIISDHVIQNYSQQHVELFLDGADPWVIAHAHVERSIVVTHEVLVPFNSSKVKIPNVCQHFGVSYVDVYRMLRYLKARFD